MCPPTFVGVPHMTRSLPSQTPPAILRRVRRLQAITDANVVLNSINPPTTLRPLELASPPLEVSIESKKTAHLLPDIGALDVNPPLNQRSQDEVQEVLQAAQGCKWHVLCFPTNCSNQSKTPQNMEVSNEVDAILVLSEVHCTQPAHQLIHELCELNRQLPAIIVLLLGGLCNHTADLTAVLKAQKSFHDVDADDVILKSGGKEEVQLAIQMSLQRVQRKMSMASYYEERFQHQDVKLKQLMERHQQMFWSSVHHIYPGFPKMQCDYPGMAALGAQRQVGKGMFGKVYFSKNPQTGECEVVKFIQKHKLSKDQVRNAWNEFRLLSTLSHKNIVTFHGVVHASHHICIHMEFVGSRNLFHAIQAAGGRFTTEQAKNYEVQIANALAYCHNQGVAHCDVKPENVVITKSDAAAIKLVDFGYAMKTDDECTDPRGTMPFMAPEVLTGGIYMPAKIDIWACGVLLLEMLCGVGKLNKMLQWGKTVQVEPQRSCELEMFFGQPGAFSASLEEVDCPLEDLVHLLEGVLETEPERRWTATDLENCFWLVSAF